MTLYQFRHILRAARAISNCNFFVVFGSQAILGHFAYAPEEYEFWQSRELDLAPLPFEQKLSDLIEGCIGELSAFDAAYGVYAHATADYTPVFPAQWEARAKNIEFDGTLAQVPSFEDLAMSKYIAGREKDHEFIAKMWQSGLLDYEIIISLLEEIPWNRSECARLDINRLRARIDADSAKRYHAPPT